MKYLSFLFAFVSVTLPQWMFAVEDTGDLVACKDGGACTFCNLVQTVHNATLWVTALAMIIAVIILIYAGYKITASRGDVGMVTDGRKLVGNVAIGVFIVVLAVTLIDILLKTTTGGGFGVWNEPDCPEPFKETAASSVNVGLKQETGITIEGYDENTPGFVNDDGFIDAPYPGGTGNNGNEGGSNTGRWDDPSTGGSSYVDDDGFIDVVLPRDSVAPGYDYDTDPKPF